VLITRYFTLFYLKIYLNTPQPNKEKEILFIMPNPIGFSATPFTNPYATTPNTLTPQQPTRMGDYSQLSGQTIATLPPQQQQGLGSLNNNPYLTSANPLATNPFAMPTNTMPGLTSINPTGFNPNGITPSIPNPYANPNPLAMPTPNPYAGLSAAQLAALGNTVPEQPKQPGFFEQILSSIGPAIPQLLTALLAPKEKTEKTEKTDKTETETSKKPKKAKGSDEVEETTETTKNSTNKPPQTTAVSEEETNTPKKPSTTQKSSAIKPKDKTTPKKTTKK
jgi:hypothetical protein